MRIEPIAYIRTDFPEKFGIPRQSGLAASLQARIVFQPEYGDPESVRGLEGFSHIWLIWGFSANPAGGKWHSSVRPPRLGGNRTMGVFATRSPFRPNPLGLSCVKVDKIEYDSNGRPVITVWGADLMDRTPIYDIKPYIRYADSRPEAVCGYVDELDERMLRVVIPTEISMKISDRTKIPALVEVLRLDPRPSYHDDADRIYGLSFSGFNVKFKVSDGVLTVVNIE